ncbi:flagellar filament capping protein FliD [Pseudoduganella sp. LjRoot289]|uniref:flagellar filament capping protein FliD n=1 Tax=Pseudoduganella sp. LjRoot289 TaxID=3342314 RepID=UPI003ECD83A1
MVNTTIGNYGNLTGTAAYGSYGSYGSFGTSTPSASVLAKVERTLASQSGGVARLNDNLARSQTRLSGLGQLQSALAGFQSIAERLAGNGLNTSASSSGKGVLNVTAGGSAKAGIYAVDVTQLAQGQILNSGIEKTSATRIGTGSSATIKVEFGTAGDGTFTAGKAGAKSITIDSKNNTLDGIASAFKAAGIDASVVKSGTGFALAIKGESGAANSLRISVSGDAAVKDLLSYNPASGNSPTAQGLTQTAAAQDAIAVIDGKDVESAGNTFKDAIKGLDLTLTGTGKTDVTVSQDSGQIAQNVSNFVNAYNDLSNKLGALQKGPLKSDQALGQVSRELNSLVQGSGGVSKTALAAAGVTIDSSGKLVLDDKKLKSAISADAGGVASLFTDEGQGLADQFDARIAVLTGKTGAIQRETQAVGKDLTVLNSKKADLAKALTTQANALVAFYTQQEQGAANDALPGYTGPRSLFDILA